MNIIWSYLLQLYLLAGLASVLGLGLHAMRARLNLSGRLETRLHCLLALACLALPFTPSPVEEKWHLDRARKNLMVAPTFVEFDRQFPSSQAKPSVSAKAPAEVPWAFFGLGAFALFVLVPGTRDLWRLHRILRGAIPWKKIGRVRVALSEHSAPFSCLWGTQAWVVIPQELLGHPRNLRVALAHEIQHHRQRDTLWLYAFFIVRALTPFHPLRHFWLQAVERAQEEGCDESLVDQGRVERRVYARCLLEMAENARGEGKRVACAANFFPFSDRNTLKRRIEQMYQQKQTNKVVAWALGLAFGLGLSAAAFASANWVKDRGLSSAQVSRMVANAKRGADFPITTNPAVVRQLNRYLGTEQGRKYMRDGIARMEELKPMLEEKRALHGMPEEIYAVGMAESGYFNYPPVENIYQSAGVWQIIPSTARILGLRVDEQLDERLIPERATDAAFRYLQSNKLRFNHWLLGILAYNIGENALQDAFEKYGTRDPWELLAKGLRTDPDYLPRVVAMAIILKNPEMLR